MGMRRVWIYFRGKLIKHDKGDGHLYPWIAIRLNESHEIFRELRDKGFFGRDVEGYLIVPEDVLKEVLGEELFNKLIGLGEGVGAGSTGRQERGLRTQAPSAEVSQYER